MKLIHLSVLLSGINSQRVSVDKTQLDLLNAGDELRCICDDDDCMEEVTWFRDGKPVGNEMQTMVDKIIFMGYEQPGKYSCKVGDKMSHPAEVRERSFGFINISPAADMSKISGQRIDLTCNVKMFPNPSEYIWLKNEQEIRSTGSRIGIKDDRLTIYSATVEDSGIYSCSVQFNDEYNISQKLHIEVRSSGFEENFPPVTSTIEGEMFDLPCSPEDKNTALYWIVFGEKMKPGEKKDRFSVDANDGTLVISRARIEDNGLIKCIAGNKSIETNLHVLKDRSVTKQKNLDKIIESESVELVCELEGKRVTWSHNGEVNEQNARKRKVFTEISVADGGEWICEAENGSRHKFVVSVNTAEQAAMNPPSVRIIDSKVELTWTETLSDVQIQYKSLSEDMWSLLNPPKLNGPSTATVDHLRSSEKVHFRIAPMDNFGKLLAPFSAASDPVTVKSTQAKDEVNLVVLGVIAGTTVLAVVVICVVIVYLKRYKNMKKTTKNGSKDFTFTKPGFYGQEYPITHCGLVRNGSDSGHGTTSSNRDDQPDHWLANYRPDQSPMLYHHSVAAHNASAHARPYTNRPETLLSATQYSDNSFHSSASGRSGRYQNPYTIGAQTMQQQQSATPGNQLPYASQYAEIEIIPKQQSQHQRKGSFHGAPNMAPPTSYLSYSNTRATEPIYESLDHKC